LCNADLAPLRDQHWGSYNIFAFWMSDVHSVGGYVFAGSLFALGLTSWQVLIALLVGIGIVNVFANLIAKSSQRNGVPYPVICRATFGVLGANIPAVIRGLIAVAWYGIQTYLASSAFVIVLLKFAPQLMPYADVHRHGWLGLSTLGWGGLHGALGAAGARVLERHGDDQEVHRFRRTGCLCRHVHPGRLHGGARGHFEHQPQSRRGQVSRLGSIARHDHGHFARRLVFFGPHAEFRRLLPVLQEL
jgi:uncharacterized membrane protein YgdD (TMEM256/DUF423 family)